MENLQELWDALSEEEKQKLFDMSDKMSEEREKRLKRLDGFEIYSGISGIYMITNKINGKKYIGQSKCISDRIASHRASLRNSCHPRTDFQNDYDQLGFEAFEVTVIESFYTEQDLKTRESYWITQYTPEELYNSEQEYKMAQNIRSRKGCL